MSNISNIEWSRMKEELRNAAVVVHQARERFVQVSTPDGGELDKERILTELATLKAARDDLAAKGDQLKAAITQGLDISIADGEHQLRFEDLLQPATPPDVPAPVTPPINEQGGKDQTPAS